MSIPSHTSHSIAVPRLSQTIRTRLSLVFCAVVIVMTLLIWFLVDATMRVQVEAVVSDTLYNKAYQMADKLDRDLFERSREIQMLTTLRAFRDPATPPVEQRALLEELQRTYPFYAWIGVTDGAGNVVVATDSLLEGKNVAERPWFVQARNKPLIGDVHEALLLAKLLPPVGDEPLRLLDVAAPITTAEGTFRGVLGAHIRWEWAREIEQSLLTPALQHDNTEFFVVAHDGTVLLGPLGGQISIRTAGNQSSVGQSVTNVMKQWNEGGVYITNAVASSGYLSYAGVGWTVYARQPTTTALAPVRQFQQRTIVIGFLASILFAVIGWLLADRFVRPLGLIAQAADRIRSGQQIDLPTYRGSDELARLADSLHQMVQKLTTQEQQLFASNQQLLHELAERQHAEAQLAEAVSARDQFLSIASHELKTPLTSLLGQTQLLQRRIIHEVGLSERSRHSVEVIERQAYRLHSMIQLLLDATQLEQGRLQLERHPYDLRLIVRQVVEELQPTLTTHTVSYSEPRTPITVNADALRLEQVVHNLVSNAVKYSPDSGAIEVVVACDTAQAFVTVRDTGIGIPADDLPNLFQKFRRALNAEAQNISGMGIGLFVVKEIVTLHGGSVTVDTIEGQGSTFTVWLPLSRLSTYDAA